jgi:hypothetical protein
MALSVAVCRGFVSSLQVQALSETDQRRFVMVLMLRASGEIGEDTPEDEIACGLRISRDELLESKSRWIQKQLMDDAWNYNAPKKRRYGSSAARVRRWREQQKTPLSCNARCNAQNEALQEALHDPDVTPNVTPETRGDVTLHVTPFVTPECSAMDSAEPLDPACGNGETPDCNAQNAGVTAAPTSGHVNVNVERYRSKENDNGEGEGVIELAGGRVALLRDAEKGIPRQMLIPGGPRIEIPKDFTRQLTALTSEVPEKFRKEKEMGTLRKLLQDLGYEHVYWNIRYVLKQLEKKPLKRSFWAYLKDACKANWGEQLRVETLALEQAREEERIKLESKKRAEEDQVERVRRERELTAEANQLLAVLPAEEVSQLENEAVALMEPADRKLAKRGDLGPKLVRNAVLVLVMRKIGSGEMGGREPPNEARENSARAPSRKRKAGDPPS